MLRVFPLYKLHATIAISAAEPSKFRLARRHTEYRTSVVAPPSGQSIRKWCEASAGENRPPSPSATGSVRALYVGVHLLSRRRCTEDGIRIASRYLATVRRACRCRRPSASPRSCRRTARRWTSSEFDHLADAMAHRLGGMGLAVAGRGNRRREEVLHLEYAARVDIYLLEVTRRTVN